MWATALPGADEELRQGDLLVGIPFPKATEVTLTAEGLSGSVDENVTAVVLDHCCTVEQHHVVLIARVKSQGLSRRMLAALENVDPVLGEYARYAHLLEPHASLPVKTGKRKVINLLDRVQLHGQGREQLQWLRDARRARMTIIARAHLRQKLAVHFGRAEDEDLAALAEDGLDSFGRPRPGVVRLTGE